MGKHTIHVRKPSSAGSDSLVPNAFGEGESVLATVDGDRKVSHDGTGASAHVNGTFEALELAMRQYPDWRNRPCMAYHPEPKSEFIQIGKTWVRVTTSDEVGFTLNNGDFIRV